MPIRRFLLAALAASGAVQAQTLSPAPLPGLWESETSIRVNGQDVMAAMRAAQQEMLKSMPPAQRAQVEAMMKAQGGALGSRQSYCLTPQEAAKSTDARELLAQMYDDAPQCRFEPVKVSGSTLSFRGRCEDPDGFTGDVGGTVTIESPKSVVFRYEGKGRMSGVEDMPGMAGAGEGPVLMVAQGRSRWVAASCGDVKPDPAR